VQSFVADVRIMQAVAVMPQRIESLPDGRTTLVVRTMDDGSSEAWVIGPRTRARFKTATGVARAVLVELNPGWAGSVLGVSMSELVDRYVTLDELWGSRGRALRDELVAIDDATELVERVTGVLAARTVESSSARLARRAVQLLDHEGRVERAAALLGITARHLRRVFVESVGIGPKDYVRCMRLQRAVRNIGASDWGRVAADAGYYDQAHLIADFHDLVGLTPTAYAKRGNRGRKPRSSRIRRPSSSVSKARARSASEPDGGSSPTDANSVARSGDSSSTTL
jgi:AraC-like DNA-binding protein